MDCSKLEVRSCLWMKLRNAKTRPDFARDFDLNAVRSIAEEVPITSVVLVKTSHELEQRWKTTCNSIGDCKLTAQSRDNIRHILHRLNLCIELSTLQPSH